MNRNYLMWGFTFGMVAVILGALGAHALEKVLSTEQVESFKTGVRYQMYHAILLIVLANAPKLQSKSIYYLLTIGIFFFSFSIYLLSLRELIGIEAIRFLGPITPIGGTLIIIAWFLLLLKAFNLKKVEP